MKKIISAMLLCAPLGALASDATVNLTFKGTLTQPTCTASFLGTNGTDIAFGNIDASDIANKTNDTVIAAAPIQDVAINLANCGGGVTKLIVGFGGSAVSGYSFKNKAPVFTDPSAGNAASGIGFALFTSKDKSAIGDAISFDGTTTTTLNIADLPKTGDNYKWPLFAKMVVANSAKLIPGTQEKYLENIAGKDLIANAYVNITYE